MVVKRIWVAISLAALAGGLGVFMAIFSRDKPAEAGPLAMAEPVLQAAAERELVRISVQNESGGYTLVKGAEGDFFIEGFEDVPQDANALFLTASRLGRVRFQELAESPDDLKPEDMRLFGLAEPRARVRLEYADGTEALLSIGAEAPDGKNNYVRNGEGAGISLAASADIGDCLRRALDFVDRTVTPPPESPNGIAFDTITLGGRVRGSEPVHILYRPLSGATEGEDSPEGGFLANPCRLVRPVEAGVDLDRGLPMLLALFGIKADRVAARLDGPLSPADFGLAEPYSTASVTGTLGGGIGGFSLRASAPNEQGLVYLQREGSDLVYEIAGSKLPWFEAGFFDLMDSLVILPFIDSVASVELRRGTNPLAAFTLSGKGDDLAVKAGDALIDTALFRNFYQTLIAARYDEYYDKALPQNAVPVLEIIYRYRNGKAPDTVAFYPATSRRVLTSLNSRRPFYTYAAYVDKVMADCEHILAGQRVLPYL
ncbi:MAG: DUF4340 domain-containing protein [Treponema sp.]|jgi:hypothetical protein|nr:DUF4340 domain-containing protein [Treponema sp.]